MWRIHRTDSPFPPNSFNSAAIAPLEDGLTINTRTMRIPRQGRFDPVHDDRVCPGGSLLGGYLYVGLSVGAGGGRGDPARHRHPEDRNALRRSARRSVAHPDDCG
nr:hypothetical protein GCM10017611_77000 [Rhodococcus wratislaviensis]